MSNQLFPGYESALDTEALIPAIQNLLVEKFKHLEITDCKISEVKFYPNRYGTILYRLQINDRFFKRRWEHYLTAQLLPKGKEPSYACPPFLRCEKENAGYFLFPNDPAIGWLPDVADSDTMTEQFRKYWLPKNIKARKMDIELLGYTPQMRAAFEYRIHMENRETNDDNWVSWIGKSNFFKPSYRIHARHYSVWKASKGKISLPRPTGFIKKPQVAFQEKVPGERLGNLINSPLIRQILENVAVSIAGFHQIRVPLANKRTAETEIGSLKRWCDVLKNVSEELKIRIERLEKKISVDIENRIQIRAPIHADFHQTNILVDGDCPYLIDFDEMAIGDPCVDLGRFLASLRTPMLRLNGHLNSLKDEMENFLKTYSAINEIDFRDVRLFEASSLLTSAASAYRLQRPNWQNEVITLLTESERVYSLSAKVDKSVYPSITALSFEERAEWAQDTDFLLALLSPHFEGDLTECEIIKVKLRSKVLELKIKATVWNGDEKTKTKLKIEIPKDPAKMKKMKKDKTHIIIPDLMMGFQFLADV